VVSACLLIRSWSSRLSACLQLQDLIARYTNVGDVVCDSMAGTLTTGMAALRMNRPCILVERQKGDLLQKAKLRLQQCYRFLKDTGLLPVVGMDPAEPQAWELDGETWMHEAQHWIVQVCSYPLHNCV
jgi:hypothetical protein